jgi:small-conductance mechanosensitive channel
MKRSFGSMNPTVRGLLLIAAIALVVVVFNLYTTLAVVYLILRIAFFIAIAVFIYLLWREHRGQIELWSRRRWLVFYAAALLIVIDLALFFAPFRHFALSGFPAFSFIAVLIICGFSMWRVWRDD